MFLELLTDAKKQLFIYQLSSRTLAQVPPEKVQLVQTLHYRLIISLIIFQLLSAISMLNVIVRIIIAAIIYVALTQYYFIKLLPSLQWQSLNKKPQLELFVKESLSTERLQMKALFTFLLFIVLSIALYFQMQPLWTNNTTLLLCIIAIVFVELIRQGIVYFKLHR